MGAGGGRIQIQDVSSSRYHHILGSSLRISSRLLELQINVLKPMYDRKVDLLKAASGRRKRGHVYSHDNITVTQRQSNHRGDGTSSSVILRRT